MGGAFQQFGGAWVVRHARLCGPIDYSRQAPLSMGFSLQTNWSGLPFPFPGFLPDPGMELTPPTSPAWPLGKTNLRERVGLGKGWGFLEIGPLPTF